MVAFLTVLNFKMRRRKRKRRKRGRREKIKESMGKIRKKKLKALAFMDGGEHLKGLSPSSWFAFTLGIQTMAPFIWTFLD
jgi:hypothetical protein